MKYTHHKNDGVIWIAAACGAFLFVGLYFAALVPADRDEIAADESVGAPIAFAESGRRVPARADGQTFSLYDDHLNQVDLRDDASSDSVAMPDFQNALSRELADLLPENLLQRRGDASAMRRLEGLLERPRSQLSTEEQLELSELQYQKHRDRLQLLEYVLNLQQSVLDERRRREFETMIERERVKTENARATFETLNKK